VTANNIEGVEPTGHHRVQRVDHLAGGRVATATTARPAPAPTHAQRPPRPLPGPAALRLPDSIPAQPVPAEPLDVVFGSRPAATCRTCAAALPAEPADVFEVEWSTGGNLCDPCLDRIHPGLAQSLVILRHLAASLRGPRADRASREMTEAVIGGIEMLAESILEQAAPARRQPRIQPVRHKRRTTRRHR
jgi:hypothetical protein